MAVSRRPLGYCTNVHPAQTLAEFLAGLDRYTVPVGRQVGRPLAAGLWLAQPVVDEVLAAPDGIRRLAGELASRSLTTYSLNAFPYGDFHANRVKEQVYLPDWTTPERLAYTERCARVLSGLLSEGDEGSISTLPIGFKRAVPLASLEASAENLVACALAFSRLAAETGRTIRLAIEPEPFCLIETTDEAIEFFRLLWRIAAGHEAEAAVREHVGVCYDVCHQAVEFEDPAASVEALDRAGVRIVKVQVSCAIELERPAENPEGIAALRSYVEPRYLHQVFGLLPDGRKAGVFDLSAEMLAEPGPDLLAADSWRIHFHVPVDAESLGPLGTTRHAILPALEAVSRLAYAPDVEVETYTWNVLPGAEKPDLVSGLAREVAATQELLDEAMAVSPSH